MLSVGVSLPDANTFMFALSHSTLECVSKPWHNVTVNSQQPWHQHRLLGALELCQFPSLAIWGHTPSYRQRHSDVRSPPLNVGVKQNSPGIHQYPQGPHLLQVLGPSIA